MLLANGAVLDAKCRAMHPGALVPPKPVTVRRKHLASLLAGAYAVCDKTDGETAVVWVNENGAVFVQNLESRVWTPMGVSLACELARSVLWGELVEKGPFGTSVVLFDCCVFRGQRVDGQPLRERLALLPKFLMVGSNAIVCKPFYGLEFDRADVRRAVTEALRGPDSPFVRDGLVFTPLDPGSSSPVFKWKDQNTIDFMFMKNNISVPYTRTSTNGFEPCDFALPRMTHNNVVNLGGLLWDCCMECAWSPFARVWTPLRVRPHRVGNTTRAAHAIWDSIVNPVTMAQLRGLQAPPPVVRDVHMGIKRELYHRAATAAAGGASSPPTPLVLAELMCGRANDRPAWAPAGFGVVVGLDLCPKRIQAAQRRSCGVDGDGCIAMLEARDVNGLKAEELGVGRFDAVSAQFSVHYMCATKRTQRRFVRTVAALLRPGGVFFGTCMDGGRVNARLLLGDGRAAAHAEEEGDEFWEIARDAGLAKARRVAVVHPGQAVPHDEPLVDFESLVAMAQHAGFDVVELAPFPTPDVRFPEFSALHNTFIFKKSLSLSAVVAPTACARQVWETVRAGRRLPLPLEAGSAAALVELQAAYAGVRARLEAVFADVGGRAKRTDFEASYKSFNAHAERLRCVQGARDGHAGHARGEQGHPRPLDPVQPLAQEHRREHHREHWRGVDERRHHRGLVALERKQVDEVGNERAADRRREDGGHVPNRELGPVALDVLPVERDEAGHARGVRDGPHGHDRLERHLGQQRLLHHWLRAP